MIRSKKRNDKREDNNTSPRMRNYYNASFKLFLLLHVQIQRGLAGGPDPTRPPEKSKIYTRFSSRDTGPDPLKNRSYQASIQCWAIIGTPAKHHLMAFPWWSDDCPLIVVLGSSLPHSTKKSQSRTPTDKTFWIRACII